MLWNDVEILSKELGKLKYDVISENLDIEFHKYESYRFYCVPYEIIKEIKSVNDKVKYFEERIKYNYMSRRL